MVLKSFRPFFSGTANAIERCYNDSSFGTLHWDVLLDPAPRSPEGACVACVSIKVAQLHLSRGEKGGTARKAEGANVIALSNGFAESGGKAVIGAEGVGRDAELFVRDVGFLYSDNARFNVSVSASFGENTRTSDIVRDEPKWEERAPSRILSRACAVKDRRGESTRGRAGLR